MHVHHHGDIRSNYNDQALVWHSVIAFTMLDFFLASTQYTSLVGFVVTCIPSKLANKLREDVTCP